MSPADVAGVSTPSPDTRISPTFASAQPLQRESRPQPATLARKTCCEKPAPSVRRRVEGTLTSAASSSATRDQATLPNTRPTAVTSGDSPTPADAPPPAARDGPLGELAISGGLLGGGGALMVGGAGAGG